MPFNYVVTAKKQTVQFTPGPSWNRAHFLCAIISTCKYISVSYLPSLSIVISKEDKKEHFIECALTKRSVSLLLLKSRKKINHLLYFSRLCFPLSVIRLYSLMAFFTLDLITCLAVFALLRIDHVCFAINAALEQKWFLSDLFTSDW